MKNIKCRECGCITKQEEGICFTCRSIVETMRSFEKVIGTNPLLGKPRKLEILKYRITR